MAWSDVFRGAKDYLDRLRARRASPSEPEPPPRYFRGAPPPPPDYRSGPPPYQFNVDLYNQIINAANRVADPNASDWQGYANVQALLNLAYLLLLEPISEPYRSQLQGAIRGLEWWVRSFSSRFQQGTTQPPQSPPAGPPPPGSGPGSGPSTPPSSQQALDDEDWPDEQEIQERPIADVQNWIEDYPEEELDEVVVTKTPGSSNVYSFTWVSDEHTITEDGGIRINLYGQRTSGSGTLIVTFKSWYPGMPAEKRRMSSTPGATYAYAGVMKTKYLAFLGSTSEESAGFAVWDYLRIRGTQAGHQHPYRLISVTGEYVPRMATRTGFRRRRQKILQVTEAAYGGEDAPYVKKVMESTLPPGPLTRFGSMVSAERRSSFTGTSWSQISYARRSSRGGYPNRGTPNRGTPNSGRP